MDTYPEVLHRFNSEPSEQNDFTVFYIDGIAWVYGVENQRGLLNSRQRTRNARKGVSFIRLEDRFVKEVHDSERFKHEECHLTHNSTPPGPDFVMRRTTDFYWPPTYSARLQQPNQPTPRVVGCHYSLAPRVNMTKDALLAEVERVKVLVCPERQEGGAEPSLEPWPPEVLEPSDPLMASVTRALRSLSFSTTEADVNVCVRAGLEYISLCAQDIELEELLENLYQTAFALYAMEAYDPTPDDVYAASDYYSTCEKLRRALDEDDDLYEKSEADEETSAKARTAADEAAKLTGAAMKQPATPVAKASVDEQEKAGFKAADVTRATREGKGLHEMLQRVLCDDNDGSDESSAGAALDKKIASLSIKDAPPLLRSCRMYHILNKSMTDPEVQHFCAESSPLVYPGSVWIVMAVSESSPPELPWQYDRCYEVTDAVVDDVEGSDAAYAMGTLVDNCGNESAPETEKISIPPADVTDKFSKLLPRCTAFSKNLKRRCNNRCSKRTPRTFPNRCWCHQSDRYEDC